MAASSTTTSADKAHAIRLAKSRRPNAVDCTSKRIAYVELFRPKRLGGGGGSSSSSSTTTRSITIDSSINDSGGGGSSKKRRHIRLYHLLFAILYMHQLYWVVSTMGVPYREFLDKAEREGFEGKFVLLLLMLLWFVVLMFSWCMGLWGVQGFVMCHLSDGIEERTSCKSNSLITSIE